MRPRPLARVVLEQRVDVTLRLREIDALTLDVLARELGLSKGDVRRRGAQDVLRSERREGRRVGLARPEGRNVIPRGSRRTVTRCLTRPELTPAEGARG